MPACGLLLAPGQFRSRNELFTAAASTAAAAPHSSSCATTCSLTQQPGSRRCFSSAHSRPHSAHRARQLQQAAGPDATLPVVRFRKFVPHHASLKTRHCAGSATACYQMRCRTCVSSTSRAVQHHHRNRCLCVMQVSTEEEFEAAIHSHDCESTAPLQLAHSRGVACGNDTYLQFVTLHSLLRMLTVQTRCLLHCRLAPLRHLDTGCD